MNESASDTRTQARFSRPLTIIYALAVVGFILGAVLWVGQHQEPMADSADTLDLPDVVLMLSWTLLVVAAAMTAARRWGLREH